MLTQPKLSLLLVDDDVDFVRFLSDQLTGDYGFATTIATNGREAQEILERSVGRFDVILTDYNMPVVDGLDLLRWMQDRSIEIPAILMTAAGSEAVEIECMKLGAYDYVRKEHLDLQHLAIVIKGTYERRQFQVARIIEEDRAQEMNLDLAATDKARDVLNAITPTLNAALARITADVERANDEVVKRLPDAYRSEVKRLIEDIHREVGLLEKGIKGLLGLYGLLHAHHAETGELEKIREVFEKRV
jgi:DNA-binding NtrC family response regulator